MKLGSKRTVLGAMGTAVVFLLGTVAAGGQAGPAQKATQKPLMSQDAFKNIQVLRNVPVDQLMTTMGFFTSSLGLSCSDCHVGGANWSDYAKDTPLKDMARKMILMMNSINGGFFGGARGVTCWTCHRGEEIPVTTPSLTALYAPPPIDNPVEITPVRNGGPIVDKIINKYITAIGGEAQLAKLTSFTGKGTWTGFDTMTPDPLEVFAKAPNQLATVVHDPILGDTTQTYNGKDNVGWIAAPPSVRPVPLLQISGDELEGAKLDAQLAFPGMIKQDLVDWQAGFPTQIGNENVVVIQGRFHAQGLPIKLYFDQKTGLLVRQVRYQHVPVGLAPIRINYSDYREVNGVKIPFHWEVIWLDGRDTYNLTEVQPNVPISEAKFGKPTPPKSLRSQDKK